MNDEGLLDDVRDARGLGASLGLSRRPIGHKLKPGTASLAIAQDTPFPWEQHHEVNRFVERLYTEIKREKRRVTFANHYTDEKSGKRFDQGKTYELDAPLARGCPRRRP